MFRFKNHRAYLDKSHLIRFVERRKSQVSLEKYLTMDLFQ